MEVLEYQPVQCKTCKSVLSQHNKVDFSNKAWWCLFCDTKNLFPPHYAENITPETLPMEMQEGPETIEYKFESGYQSTTSFIFLINTAMEDEEELNELKEALIAAIENIPKKSKIAIVSYGKHVQVHEIAYREFQMSHSLKGDKDYTVEEIYSLLNLRMAQKGKSPDVPYTKLKGTLEEFEFNITTIIDDLRVDGFRREKAKRQPNCTGLGIKVAVTLGEALFSGEPCRLMAFIGEPSSIGKGQITSQMYVDTIRSNLDFKNKTNQTRFFSDAFKFYSDLSITAMKSSLVVDLFACNYDQVGLKEMRKLPERTGGYILLTDSFSTLLFKDSIKNIFSLDNEGSLKQTYKGRMEVFSRPNLKVAGGIGYLVSMYVNNTNVSENPVGEGETRVWNLGGGDPNSTYSIILDPCGDEATFKTDTPIQIMTQFVGSDSFTRMRVTTLKKKMVLALTDANKDLVINSFDQEAAMIMMARIGVVKGESVESSEVLQWLDKSLIRLLKQFSTYKKDNPSSFKLPQSLNYFPQFVYYFRRSYFVHPFNCSLDENTLYKLTLLHETVANCSIMIQPLLYEYKADSAEPNPVFLDLSSMKNDRILLLDTFFKVCVWHGPDVCKWRNDGLHLQSDYEYLQDFLDTPQRHAEDIILERTPTPAFVSCDSGSGQERILKFVLSPTNNNGENLKALEGFVSDDIDWKTFNSHLIKLTVQA